MTNQKINIQFNLPLYLKTDAGTICIIENPDRMRTICSQSGSLEVKATSYLGTAYNVSNILSQDELLDEISKLKKKFKVVIQNLDFVENQITNKPQFETESDNDNDSNINYDALAEMVIAASPNDNEVTK